MNHKSIIAQRLVTIPLSLYIHFPWCLNKCPYCDFNSYRLSNKEVIPTYVARLLDDLKAEGERYGGGRLESIYFGGGTPSLFAPNFVAEIIKEAKRWFSNVSEIEITLEANPGTINVDLCREFKDVGINRLSIGVQSFSGEQLKTLRRVHGVEQALMAIDAAKSAGFTNFNIDLMFGLPGQTVEDAVKDLQIASSFTPQHLSWYQLTVDSRFTSETGIPYSKLPHEEQLWEMQQAGKIFLAGRGLDQYEVSAYSCSFDSRCQHNVNYWQFGDYLGIGAGAHGKVTLDDFQVRRSEKTASPHNYLKFMDNISKEEVITPEKLPLEFMLNALRLYQPISYELFQKRTGVVISAIEEQLQHAQELGLLELRDDVIITTSHGKNFLNDLEEIFL